MNRLNTADLGPGVNNGHHDKRPVSGIGAGAGAAGNSMDLRKGNSATLSGALVLVAISTLVSMLAYAGPLGNATTLAREFGTRSAGTTWILSSMSLGLAVAMLGAGVLADDLGRRRVFRLGAQVFALGSLICVLARLDERGIGTTIFVAGRIVEGIGAAGMIATGLGLVAALAGSDADRAASARWWAVAMGAGIALGPVMTGLFDVIGPAWWPLTYALMAIAGLWIAQAAPTMLPEVISPQPRRLDVKGLALLTVGLTLVLVALVESRSGEPAIAWSAGVAGVLVMGALVLTQLRGTTTLVDRSLFARNDFRAANVAGLVCGLGVIAIMLFACTYLTRALGISTLQAGLVLCLWSGTSAVTAIAFRSLLIRLAGDVQLMIGLIGVGIGIALMTGVAPGASVWQVVPGLLVAGVASGVLNAGLARQSVASVPADRAAMGTGANNTMRYVGSAIGVTVVSVISLSSADMGRGWYWATVVTAGVSVVGAGVVWGFWRRERRPARV